MPKDEWRRVRDRDLAKRAKREIAEGHLHSYEYIWDDGTASTRAESARLPDPEPLPLLQRPARGITTPTQQAEYWLKVARNGKTTQRREVSARLTKLALSHKAVMKHLVGLVCSQNVFMAKQSQTALIGCGSAAIRPLIRSLVRSPSRITTITPVLAKLGSEALEELLKRIDDPQESIRSVISQTLIHIGQPAVPLLVKRLRNTSNPAKIQAIDLLAKMGRDATEAIQPLIELSNGSERTLVRVQAAKAWRAIRLKPR